MRIVAVAQTHPDVNHPYWGVFVQKSLLSLRAAGVEVEAVVGRPYAPSWLPGRVVAEFQGIPRIQESEYRTHFPRYPYLVPKDAMYWATGLFHRAVIARYMLRELPRPDIVHAQHEFPDGYGAARAAARWRVPLVLSSHGEIAQRRARGRIESPMVKRTMRAAAAICAVSQHQKAVVDGITDQPQKTVVLPIGGDDELLEILRPAAEGPPQFLFVGQLVPRKGVADLICAFREVLKIVPAARLRIVGQGPLMGDLVQLSRDISSNISFLSGVSPEHLREEYRHATTFVLPSYAEGRPTVIYEAMAAGLPVIASSVGGIPEQVISGVTGALFKPGDTKDLAAKMLAAATDDAGWRRMGGLGRRRTIEKHWTWAGHAKRLERLYSAVLVDADPDLTRLGEET